VLATLTAAQLLTLHSLLEAWRGGASWPGLSKIGEAIGITRSQAAAVATELEELSSPQARPTEDVLATARTGVESALKRSALALPKAKRPTFTVTITPITARRHVVSVRASRLDAAVLGVLTGALIAAEAEGVTAIADGVHGILRA
jgi:hypothetical protein